MCVRMLWFSCFVCKIPWRQVCCWTWNVEQTVAMPLRISLSADVTGIQLRSSGVMCWRALSVLSHWDSATQRRTPEIGLRSHGIVAGTWKESLRHAPAPTRTPQMDCSPQCNKHLCTLTRAAIGLSEVSTICDATLMSNSECSVCLFLTCGHL